MIAGLKPYPVMKDSGMDWLGEVPVHWEVRRNGRLFVQRNETGYPDLPILEVSLRTGVRVRDFANSTRKQVMSERDKYKRAAIGDIAYNMMRMWQGAVGVVPEHGLISPAYVVARPLPGANASYFGRLFRTPAYMQEVDNYSRGIVKDRNRLYWEDFKRIPTCYPPPEEQAAIVRYLDHVDQRVRRLVRAKHKLIALLTEQKQAIIHRAVSRGLDPDVPLKESGVEWLGEVPAHWEVVRVRRLVKRIDQGVSPQAEATLAEDGWWGVLKAGCVNGGVFREREHKRLPSDFEVDECLAVAIGDVLISRACGSPRLVGSVGRVQSLNYRVILSDKIFRPVFKVPGMAGFIVRAMNARYFRTQVELAISGAEGLANNLPLSALKDLLIAIPPLDEAMEISESLDTQLRGLDTAIDRANREIDLLTEYRSRLTADVVTGKLDAREVAAALPEVDPLTADDEPDPLDAESETNVEDLEGIPEGAEA